MFIPHGSESTRETLPCDEHGLRESSVVVVGWGVLVGRTSRGTCCPGTGDGAGGSAVAGLDPDAGLIAAPLVAALLVLAPA